MNMYNMISEWHKEWDDMGEISASKDISNNIFTDLNRIKNLKHIDHRYIEIVKSIIATLDVLECVCLLEDYDIKNGIPIQALNNYVKDVIKPYMKEKSQWEDKYFLATFSVLEPYVIRDKKYFITKRSNTVTSFLFDIVYPVCKKNNINQKEMLKIGVYANVIKKLMLMVECNQIDNSFAFNFLHHTVHKYKNGFKLDDISTFFLLLMVTNPLTVDEQELKNKVFHVIDTDIQTYYPLLKKHARMSVIKELNSKLKMGEGLDIKKKLWRSTKSYMNVKHSYAFWTDEGYKAFHMYGSGPFMIKEEKDGLITIVMPNNKDGSAFSTHYLQSQEVDFSIKK